MPYEFKLPDLGEGVQEGEIVRWLVSEGQTIAEDQPLVEVMTDKVTAEIPSPVGGRILRLRAGEGEVVPVGTPLVEIEGDGGQPSAPPEAKVAAPKPAAPQTAPEGRRPLAVPAVRKLAEELGVGLNAVTPTGPGGRITLSDVRAHAAGKGPRPALEAPAPPEVVPPPPRAPAMEERIPLRGVRRAIAEHLLQSHQQTAPYTYVDECDFTELVRLRDRVQPLAEQRGIHLTYLPFVIAATCAALKEHPWLNAVVDAKTRELVVKGDYHLGFAVQTDEGLLVPVIRDADQMHLLAMAQEIERLSTAARAGQLTRAELTGGTFSITSLGPLGGLLATPIINTPQVAILGVHKISPRPAVRDGQVVIRQLANLSLTFDHRYIDGAVGAAFAATLIRYLEDPAVLLFSLAEFHHR